MPRPRARPLFELAGQWIAAEPGARNLYRFWHDAGAGRTRRESLRTTDPETAKRRLAEIVVRGAPKSVSAHLAVLLEDYFLARTDHLPSAKPARHAGCLLLQHWGETARVREITDGQQQAFAQACRARGHSLSYISRNLSVLAAALAHAKLDVAVCYNEAAMRARWGLTGPPPRQVFVPADAELARFLAAAPFPDDLFRWCLIAMLTGCRPEAALDLTPAQRLQEAGLVNLNPAGRVQNRKHRPTVRAPQALTGWLDKWDAAAARRAAIATAGVPVHARYCGYASLESVQTAIERLRAREAVNLPRLSAYSFRHKAVTVLRLARVPEDEIAMQVGHRRRDVRTTAGYGEWSPDYLARAAAAFDAWLARLQKLTERPLFSQGIPKTLRGRIKHAA